MLGNLGRSAVFRVRNATMDRPLYHREHRFTPTEADVAQRRLLAAKADQENRLLGEFLTHTGEAVGNRASWSSRLGIRPSGRESSQTYQLVSTGGKPVGGFVYRAPWTVRL